jgi:hypothetical protein
MKRLAGIMALAAVSLLITATAALADSHYPITDDTSVEGAGGSGGTAFTGSDVSMAAVAIAALLVIGLTALFVARRRAARLAA